MSRRFQGTARAAAERIGGIFAQLPGEGRRPPAWPSCSTTSSRRPAIASALTAVEEDLERWANLLELRADLERYDSVDPAEALAVYLEQVALIADVDSMNDDARRARSP